MFTKNEIVDKALENKANRGFKYLSGSHFFGRLYGHAVWATKKVYKRIASSAKPGKNRM